MSNVIARTSASGVLQQVPKSSSLSLSKPLSSTSRPSTPLKQSQPTHSSSPGLWKHPKLDEIARRQRRTTFDYDNVRMILWNVSAFLTTWLFRDHLSSVSFVHGNIVAPIHRVLGAWPLYTFYILLAFNVVQALLPLWRGKDNLSDIDLTPSQRSLLGLDPNATPPATPDTKYMTPPRYARSTGSRSGTPGSRSSSYSGSPLAYKANSSVRQVSGSGFPQVGTPLWQKALGNSGSKRNSFGVSSASGSPLKESSVFVPLTPSPVAKSSGVPISSKWIYHRGRSMSASRSLA